MYNTIFKPGTVICANYKEFDGKKQPGVFVVIYDEALDSHHRFLNNIIVLKCTTSDAIVGNYTVALNDGHNPSIERDTIVACSKLQILDKSQVYKVVCDLDSRTFKKVYKEYKSFQREMERQMEGVL